MGKAPEARDDLSVPKTRDVFRADNYLGEMWSVAASTLIQGDGLVLQLEVLRVHER